MQTSRRCRIGLQLPWYLIILITITMSIPAGAQDSAAVQAEEAPHRFHMGYDQGISARYQINRFWTVGLIVSSERWGSLYSNSSDSSYVNSSLSSANSRRYEDFFVYVDVIKTFKKWRHFTIRGFASGGGGQIHEVADYRYYTQEVETTDIIQDNETNLRVASRAGLMPGFTYGIFTFETRFGLEATFSQTTSPEKASDRQIGNTSNISLMYPSSFLAGIIVHVAIF